MTREYVDNPCLDKASTETLGPNFEDMPLCSHLKAKLAKGGEYYAPAHRLLRDEAVTAKAISRQLHFYRNGKKFLILTGKSGIKEVGD